MVGGGQDAFVGAVHRMAARMDGRIDLVCGAFSSNRQRSREGGLALDLDPERVYNSYRDMFRKETKLPEDDRMDFVTIVTPTNMHYPIAMASLDAGYHVLCDVPMTMTLDEAVNLARKLEATGGIFCLTHTYTAYPMVIEARGLVQKGRLGELRRIVVEYPQGWLATRQETSGNKQAIWRTDPKRAGASCCVSELGSHCENLVHFITGLRVSAVCADMTTFVAGRPLEDDASVLLRFDNDARGVMWTSQLALGESNGLSIRVYGDKGSLLWSQQTPNKLLLHWLNKPSEIRQTGTESAGAAARAAALFEGGRPEGYVEAYSNLYSTFADTLLKRISGKKPKASDGGFPGVEEGIRGLKFVEAVVRSARGTEKWVEVEA